MGKKKSNLGQSSRRRRYERNRRNNQPRQSDTDSVDEEPCCSTSAQPAKRKRTSQPESDQVVVTINNLDRETTDSDEIDLDDLVTLSNVGNIFEQSMCQHCKAYKWPSEKPGMCCNSGKFSAPPVSEPPAELLKIHSNSASFRKNMRTYNNMFALSSFGCDKEVRCNGFSPMVKICGKIYHRIGSLIPVTGESPVFAQLYFHDPEHELENRLKTAEGQRVVDQLLVSDVQRLLHDVNPYVAQVTQARNLSASTPDECVIKLTPKQGDKTYSLPATSELAGIQPTTTARCREVVFQLNGQTRRISELHGLYDPLHYVLLFPHGEEGFDLESKIRKKEQGEAGSSMYKFYRYRLQVRDQAITANFLLRCGKLTQQYAIDQFLKIESDRLDYHRLKSSQEKYRAANYTALNDSLADDNIGEPGKRIILPSSHIGSPRWYHRAYLDAMSIVRKYGKPDIFLTFTCNPDWPEIKGSLYPGETPSDRPDIIARVFHQKVQELIDEIKSGKVFGRVKSYILVKEDQKRGLPHIHALIHMADEDKLRTPTSIDRVIKAELPDETNHPKLFEIIRKFNIHGPCSPEYCRTADTAKRCDKGFPQPYNNGSTTFSGNYYPDYRRRDVHHGGHTCEKWRGSKSELVDNSYVVPYNPYLSERYNAHINVECVHSVSAVKYLFKYVTKGSDKACFTVEPATTESQEINEIQTFKDGRYVNAGDAFWRLYEFPIMVREPSVLQLQIHEEDQESVVFRDGEAEEAADRGPPTTQLTAYFDLNKTDRKARDILYPDIPRHYTWHKKDKVWKKRQRNLSKVATKDGSMSDQIGRIPSFYLTPRNSELFYLRTLLYNVTGATSFEALRTVNEQTFRTFKEACQELGLLENDDAVIKALEEAAQIRIGFDLRALFVTILAFGEPKDPIGLWEKFKDVLAEDIKRQRKGEKVEERDRMLALWRIQEHLRVFSFDLLDDFGIDRPICTNAVSDQAEYDIDQLREMHKEYLSMLTEEQNSVYEKVATSIEKNEGKCFILDAAAGCGKTLLITTLLAKVRSVGDVAIATAISGIAALLLPGGRTAHSQLKIPIELTEESCCNISPRERLAQSLQVCKLLVFDEFPQADKLLYEAVDRSLRDITGIDRTFGGITVLMSGDWRQILPVVIRGNAGDVINATLKRSKLWNDITVLKLKTNMRLNNQNAGEAKRFLDYQMAVGEGLIKTDEEGLIPIPESLRLPQNDIQGLCDFVYDDFENQYRDMSWLSSRAILCTTNEIVNEVNELMLDRVAGEEKVLLSYDQPINTEQPDDYPVEFLNSIDPSGMPLHKLKLKVGAPVMLLRNLDPRKGHCNGSRYIITSIGDHVVDCTVSFGPHVGERKFVPKIKLRTTDKFMPFTLQRLQYPLKLCFAMTTNKAQGQSIQKLGIYLKQDVFAHGQLYVALSRAKDPQMVKIVRPVDGTRMVNVVYRQIFRD